MDCWAQLVDYFFGEFDPAYIADIVFGPFKHTELDKNNTDNKNEVSIHLCDPRRLWKRIVDPFALIHTITSPQVYRGGYANGIPIIIDTGASVCITPCKDDFLDYRASKVKIRDLSKSNTVAGEGTIGWKIRDITGKIVNVDLPGYHIPHAEVRLLSPQPLLSKCDSRAAIGYIRNADLVLCLGR